MHHTHSSQCQQALRVCVCARPAGPCRLQIEPRPTDTVEVAVLGENEVREQHLRSVTLELIGKWGWFESVADAADNHREGRGYEFSDAAGLS
jgi:hypothetical protein